MQDTTTFIITEEKEYQDCEMDKVVATGLDLSDSWFSHIAFGHGWFDRTNFRDCSLVNVMFLSCDLSESVFGGSHFKGCTFSGCKFLGSSFSDVVLQECRFADCIFNYGTWDKSRLKKRSNSPHVPSRTQASLPLHSPFLLRSIPAISPKRLSPAQA